MLNLFFIFVLLILFYILRKKENFKTSIKRLTREQMKEILSKNEEEFNFLNEDDVNSYLTEYQCLDYEDIRI